MAAAYASFAIFFAFIGAAFGAGYGVSNIFFYAFISGSNASILLFIFIVIKQNVSLEKFL